MSSLDLDGCGLGPPAAADAPEYGGAVDTRGVCRADGNGGGAAAVRRAPSLLQMPDGGDEVGLARVILCAVELGRTRNMNGARIEAGAARS